MNPGPKNSQDTAITFARKKYGNKRTKLQGPKKEKTNTRLHWPAPPQTKMPLQCCWTTKAAANPKQNRENHQHNKTQPKSKARGFSATCSQTCVGRAPLGFIHTEIQARRAAKQRTWVKQNKTQRKEKKRTHRESTHEKAKRTTTIRPEG